MNSPIGHLELALLRISLHRLERRFLKTVAPRYVELDDARAQAAKLRARFYPAAHRESLAAREQARISAEACARASVHPTADPGLFRLLHRELARNYHPDLAPDAAYRALCEQLMTEVNLAHASEDLECLQILREALKDPVDVVREQHELNQTPLAELGERVEYAARHRHDLLEDLSNQLQELTLDEKMRTGQSARASVTYPTGASLVARALGDLASLSVRRLEFPADRSMGQLSIRGEFDIDAQPALLGAARGMVGVPFGKTVILRLDASCSDLSPLTRLDPDDINGLIDEWPDFVATNDESLLPLSRFTRIEELRLGRTEISGRVFDEWPSLHELRVLVLDETEFDDEGLLRLEGSVWMQRLDLSFTRVTGRGMRALHHMTALRELSLYGTTVADSDLALLDGTPHIRNLNLGLTCVTNDGAARLAGLRELQVLHLGGTGVTDAVLDSLEGLTNLRELVLWETAITSAGARRLQNFKGLRYLDLDKTEVTGDAMRGFREARPEVKLPSDVWQES